MAPKGAQRAPQKRPGNPAHGVLKSSATGINHEEAPQGQILEPNGWRLVLLRTPRPTSGAKTDPPDKLWSNLDGFFQNRETWVEQVSAKMGETSMFKTKEEEGHTTCGQEKEEN